MRSEIQIQYKEARALIHQGDFLLWHYTGGTLGRMILSRAPKETPYVHVGMAIVAGYEGGPIHSVDIQYRRGGQRRRLSQDVAQWPGKIEVWRVKQHRGKHDWDANVVAAEMERIIDTPYGLRTGLAYYLRTARWWPFMNPLPDERLEAQIKPVCSQAVAIACRKCGYDPLPKDEPVTTPWHYAMNGFASYRFTLT
jgi:hypothetical protein